MDMDRCSWKRLDFFRGLQHSPQLQRGKSPGSMHIPFSPHDGAIISLSPRRVQRPDDAKACTSVNRASWLRCFARHLTCLFMFLDLNCWQLMSMPGPSLEKPDLLLDECPRQLASTGFPKKKLSSSLRFRAAGFRRLVAL